MNKSDIFTPDNISQLMSSKLYNYGSLLEPSVGTGNLLKFITIENYDYIDIYDINQEYIDSIENKPNINKTIGDFLLITNKKKYLNIILNPPYIKIQELPKEYVTLLKKQWKIFNKGNIDIYYIFLMKCLELLDDNGIMIAITPNSYLHNKSSLEFRKYLFNNTIIKEIIDFKETKIFKNIAVYCCITIFSKERKTNLIYNNNLIDYNVINNKNNTDYLLHYIPLTFEPNVIKNKLGDICKIYNGIATLRDKIFIHDNKLFEEPCWKPIITSTKTKYCVFPYDNNGKIIDENTFKLENLNTYNYLLTMKDELEKRDNGKIIYPKWYSYGRTQSLVISKMEKVIYCPVFFNPLNLNFRIETPTLHVSCLCIEPKNIEDIDLIIDIIKQNIDYIKNNSSIKNNGWINISSSILKNISIK